MHPVNIIARSCVLNFQTYHPGHIYVHVYVLCFIMDTCVMWTCLCETAPLQKAPEVKKEFGLTFETGEPLFPCLRAEYSLVESSRDRLGISACKRNAKACHAMALPCFL